MTQTAKTIGRRELLRGGGVAALAVAGAAVVPFVASASRPGDLANLMRLYWRQVDDYNATDHYTDEHSDAHAAATYEKTMRLIVGVPARTADDALSALDWLCKEAMLGVLSASNQGLHRLDSLETARRDYHANGR
jgi:hypothetical protein